MRMRNKAPILSLLFGMILTTSAAAGEADEASLEILTSTLQANRKAFVAVNLDLEDAEAKAFWPLYDRYQSDLTSVRERFFALIEDYTTHFATMSDEKAHQIVKDYLAIEDERNEVRRKYLAPFSEVLPGRKVARFYQIENKIEAVLRYQLAREIPVIEE